MLWKYNIFRCYGNILIRMLYKYNIFRCYGNITVLTHLRCTEPGSLLHSLAANRALGKMCNIFPRRRVILRLHRNISLAPFPFAQIAGPYPHLQSSISFTLHNLYLRCDTQHYVHRVLLRTTFFALHCITLLIKILHENILFSYITKQ